MTIQEIQLLLEKYDSREISPAEYQRLNNLTKSDPVLKQEFEELNNIILGIKSYALREELENIMKDLDKNSKNK